MKSIRLSLGTFIALTLLLATSMPAYAWDIEEDTYSSDDASGENTSSEDTSLDSTETESSGRYGDTEEEEALPSPPPVMEDDDEEDLYPKKRRPPPSREEDDEDGWEPAGNYQGGGHSRGARQRQDDDEDDGASSSNSFFGKKSLGLTAELTLGGLFRQGSLGSLESKFGLGLSVSWNLGRMLFDPELKILHRGLWIELAWLHPFSASGEEGTEMTRVTQSQNNFTLSAIFGYPLWRLLLYGKLGPALYIGGLNYDIDGSTGHWTLLRGGIVYGIGAHTMFFLNDTIGLSGRIELLGHRRHYYNDLQFTVSLGAAF